MDALDVFNKISIFVVGSIIIWGVGKIMNAGINPMPIRPHADGIPPAAMGIVNKFIILVVWSIICGIMNFIPALTTELDYNTTGGFPNDLWTIGLAFLAAWFFILDVPATLFSLRMGAEDLSFVPIVVIPSLIIGGFAAAYVIMSINYFNFYFGMGWW